MVGGMVKLSMLKDADGARVTDYEFVPTITQKEGYTTNETAYKLSDYTDELAARSTVGQSDGGRGTTRQWYVDFCQEVLGEAFDTDTMSVHGTL
jgi:poly-gamma-glutamate synthesis protein (capsule biosynthesis protein)